MLQNHQLSRNRELKAVEILGNQSWSTCQGVRRAVRRCVWRRLFIWVCAIWNQDSCFGLDCESEIQWLWMASNIAATLLPWLVRASDCKENYAEGTRRFTFIWKNALFRAVLELINVVSCIEKHFPCQWIPQHRWLENIWREKKRIRCETASKYSRWSHDIRQNVDQRNHSSSEGILDSILRRNRKIIAQLWVADFKFRCIH